MLIGKMEGWWGKRLALLPLVKEKNQDYALDRGTLRLCKSSEFSLSHGEKNL